MRWQWVVLAAGIAAAACSMRERNWSRCDRNNPCRNDVECDYDAGICLLAQVDVRDADPIDARDASTVDMRRDCERDDQCTRPDAPVCMGGTCQPCEARAEFCATQAGRPHCVMGACVACRDGADCKDPTKPICTMGGVCSSCTPQTQARCPAGMPMCGADGRCVQCVTSAHCDATPTTPICVAGRCEKCSTTLPEARCGGTRPPACAPSGACVECVDSKRDCANPSRPICGATNACQPCTTDKECELRDGPDPGVCLTNEGGRCATAAETLFVQFGDTCAGNGTARLPFCLPQEAINAIRQMPEKRVIVLRGGKDFPEWMADLGAASKLSIIGQMGARVNTGATGVKLMSGDHYLRGITFHRGSDTAITGGAATNVAIDRCTIVDNLSGLDLAGGFRITNSVIAKNGPKTNPAAWGGVLVRGKAAGKTRLFRNNTVFENAGGAIHCTDESFPIEASIIRAVPPMDAKVTVTGACTLDATNTCCAGNAPGIDSTTFRLTEASVCVDKVPRASATTEDIDGEPRPSGPMSDCGADELQKRP